MSKLSSVFVLVILVLLSCNKEEVASIDDMHRVAQHNIPLVEIWTADGLGITDKYTWKDATFQLKGNGHFSDIATTSIELKGRGNSTFKYPKKPFNIQFSDKQPLLGMKKSRKWVFLANYRDPTLLRNDITLFLGRKCRFLEWTPSGEFVDLYVNGRYEGNYYVVEKINVNKQHVDINEMTASDVEGDALTGGYLLELDKRRDGHVSFRTERCRVPVNIVSPKEGECQPEHVEYIRAFLSEMEELLLSGEFATVYDRYIDLPSFIDYFLVQSLSGNVDFASPLSSYAYKKRAGKLYAGPLWDFDFSTYYKEEVTLRTNALWFRPLFMDVYFVERLKLRWRELRPILEADVFDYMERRKDYIFLSAMDNFQAYPYDMSVNKYNMQDFGFLYSYERMREVLRIRFQNMTEKIEAL